MDWNAPLVQDANLIRAVVPFANADADVEFFPVLGRAILIVPSLPKKLTDKEIAEINKKSPWDVDVVSLTEFENMKLNGVEQFITAPNISTDVAKLLVRHGYFSFDDLSVVDPNWLAEHSDIDLKTVDSIIEYADVQALRFDQNGR